MLNIYNLEKWEVLKALYDKAKPLGLGLLHYTPEPMAPATARDMVRGAGLYFDYVSGRVMKIDLSENSYPNKIKTYLYDRDNGPGAAQEAIDDYFTDPRRPADPKK